MYSGSLYDDKRARDAQRWDEEHYGKEECYHCGNADDPSNEYREDFNRWLCNECFQYYKKKEENDW